MRKTLLTNDLRMSIICKAFYFTDGCGYVFEKDLRFNLLYDLYGALLNEHRSEIFSLYYAEDLSLSEIAEDTGLSRQGVRATLKPAQFTSASSAGSCAIASATLSGSRRSK